MKPLRSGSLAFLLLLLLSQSGLAGFQLSMGPVYLAATDAAGCGELPAYFESLNELANVIDTKMANELPAIADDLDIMGVSSISSVLLYLTPDELDNLVKLTDEYVASIESIIPPEIAVEVHRSLVKTYRLFANFTRASANFGFADASETYIPVLTSALDEFDSSLNVLGAKCPAFFENFELSRSAPPPSSVPGRAELKNVHDAIAAQGVSVEYGQQTVRIDGVTPVGQQLTVEGTPVYVFIFDSSEDRVEQTTDLVADTLEIKMPSGADAATGDLAISQGSNVMVVSDGASQSLQRQIENGVSKLP